MPSTIPEVSEIVPTYITMPSWKCDISHCKTYEELPVEARNYIEKVEELSGLSFVMISVGADRDATIVRKDIF